MNEKPYYVQKKEYSKPPAFGYASKTAGIAQAMKRKEDGIKRHTDLKSVSIAVSSAFNSTTELVNILVDKGIVSLEKNGKRSMEDYWKTHTSLYKQMLERFTDAQDDAKNEYLGEVSEVVNKVARQADLKMENRDLSAMDTVNPETGDASIPANTLD